MSLNRNKIIKIVVWAFRIFPILAILYFIFAFGQNLKHITIDNIINFTPDNYFIASILVIALYILKSVSIVFPVAVLYISSGMIFSPIIAIVINIIGLFAGISTMYWIGRFAGKQSIDKLVFKYKKVESLKRIGNENELFISYILRVINLLPTDIVSMILGSSSIDYKKFVVGSLAGLFPSMIAITFLGSSVLNPDSPQFIISCISVILISAISFFLYHKSVKLTKK